MNKQLLPLTGIVLGTFGPALLLGGLLVLYPAPVQASMKFTQQTGKGCPVCHVTPPALNDTGKKFKANGNKL